MTGPYIIPKVVYNNELYGYESDGVGHSKYAFKLVGDKWVQVGTKRDIEPRVVYNNELYGYGKDDRAYKLVKK